MQPVAPYPMAHLAATHLRGDHVVLAPHATAAQLRETVARAGIGFDHAGGEMPLASLRYDFPGRGERAGAMAGCIVTDRRLFGRMRASNVPDTLIDLPFAPVTGARVEGGLLSKHLAVQLGPHEVRVPVFADRLEPFFRALLALPPPLRMFPPAVPLATADDPAAARAAHAQLVSGDVRAGLLVWLADELARRGALTMGDAAALVQRAWLFDRGLRFGRGMAQQFWTVALPPAAALDAVRALLGAPFQQFAEGPGVTVDIHPPAAAGAGSNVASNIVGLASLALLGVGWVSFARESNLRFVRVTVVPMPWGAGVRFLGSDGATFRPLSVFSPALVAGLLDALDVLEARGLLAQCVFGPAHPPEALLGVPPAPLDERLTALVGPTDLRAFFAPPR